MRGEAQRGSKQIRAAARDDQVTAERNGNKRDWRRETLGTLLDKLEEEVKEFVKDVMDGNRKGMRWEGSDVRWTVTCIEDHHGVLELEEGVREEEKIESGLSPDRVGAQHPLYDSMQELATKYYECWQDAEARCLALETWVKAVGKRREVAESRAAQLEEALRKIRVHAASRWILETVDAALSSFRASEAPEKEEK